VRFLLHGVDVHAFARQHFGDARDDARFVVNHQAKIPACGLGLGDDGEFVGIEESGHVLCAESSWGQVAGNLH